MDTNELLKEVRIEAIIGDYLVFDSKERDDDYRALCPFHEDKNPSFSVNLNKQVFYCYGCQVGGNAITFLSLIEKISTKEAIELIKIKLGIIDVKDQFTILEEITNYYQEKLDQIKPYLDKRQFNQKMINDFRIGYSGSDAFELGRKFRDYRSTLEELGLITVKYNNTPSEMVISTFTNRLIIPIIDHLGVLAFSGRTLIDSKQKYLNLINNKFFNRRRSLYGLNSAKKSIKENNFCYLVEGFFDVSRMQSTKYKNTVSSFGTNLTSEQAQLLRRFTDHVVFINDSDDAGFKALEKSIFTVLSAGLTFDILILPDNQDPDSFFSVKGNDINDLSFMSGKDALLTLFSRQEILDELILKCDNPDIIPDGVFNLFKINREFIQHKKIHKFNNKKITKLSLMDNLVLFIDIFPEYQDMIPKYLLSLFNESKENKDVLNLIFNLNPFKNVTKSELVFKELLNQLKENHETVKN